MYFFKNLLWTILLILTIDFLKPSKVTEAKTYYFKANSSNEFQIYNRIQLNDNNNIVNNSVINHRTKFYVRTNGQRKIPQNQFLDSEWNYDWKQIPKSNLPVYLYKLYESVQENVQNSELLPQKSIKRILFNSQLLFAGEDYNNSSKIIKFNLNSLNHIQENVSDIELHFYLTINNSSEIYKQSIVVRLYQIENSTNSIENADIHRLLNVIYIYQAEIGWQIFKIRTALNNWIEDGNEDLALFITISKPNENEFYDIFQDTTTEGNLRTFLLINTVQEDYNQLQINSITTSNTNNKCNKHDWYINFKSISWGEIIIAPDGYMAYKCLGKCYRYDQTIANHAKMLNIIPEQYSNVCCVPSKYFPLPIMFYDKFGNVVIKTYEEMIVAECGCR